MKVARGHIHSSQGSSGSYWQPCNHIPPTSDDKMLLNTLRGTCVESFLSLGMQ